MSSHYVLYVGHDNRNPSNFCKGSMSCMQHLTELPDDLIHIQDVDILRQKQKLPSWLNGTPILVDKTTLQKYKGTAAVNKLESIKNSRDTNNTSKVEDITDTLNTQHSLNEDSPNLDDAFKIDAVAAQTKERDGKVTEQDVQAFIAQRNASGPAVSVPPPQMS